MIDSELPVSAVLAALPSSDMARSEAFYEALIGRPVDERPMPVLAQWRWGEIVLQIVDDADRAGGGLVTVVVSDMAVAVAGLRSRGLSMNASEGTVVAQVASLEDPDGNQITLVERR
jgi:glyoxylase I family protein